MHAPTLATLASLLLTFLPPSAELGAQTQTQPAAAPAPATPWLDLGLDAAIDWVRDPLVLTEARRGGRPPKVEFDRAAALDEAIAQGQAQNKPVLWYAFRIQENALKGQQMYRSPVLDFYMQHVVFADPDVANVVNSRFVPVRLLCDETLAKRFELRPLDVIEPMIVFIDGDGKPIHVLQRIRTFSAHWFAEVLRSVLEKSPQPEPEGLTVEQALTQGRWERALALAQHGEQADSPRAHYLAATALRRLRRPDEALALLATIQDKKLAGAVAAEKGLVYTLQGQVDAALRELDVAYRAGGERAAEAAYWLACNRLREGDEAEAMRMFQLAADRWPADPFGKKARANLLIGPDERPVGATFSGFEHFGFLPEAAYSGLPKDTSWAGARLGAKEIATRGVRFLLSMQRSHGGFTDSRYAYWPDPTITPNTWVAISALCATALLEWREVAPDQVDAALLRAEQYLFDPFRLRRGANEDVYADAYRLLYLEQKMRANEAHKAECLTRMNTILKEAHGRQKGNGFFAHEYDNAFCTSVMLWSALRAKNAGASVPDELIDKAGAALISARAKNGAFAYGGSARPDRDGSLKDSSARIAHCEAVLLAVGRSEGKNLEAAFDTFWQYLDRIERVRRNDFHSDGELAGFFFFHSIFHTSEALKLLGEDRRKDAQGKLLALLQRIPEIDGSFVDSHEIGRSYGTAMALLTLRNVAE